MRTRELVTLIASGVLSAGAWAAVAENAPPPVAPVVAEPVRNPMPGAANAPPRKPPERKTNEVRKASRDSAKPPLPLLDEKNHGLGCAQN
ncbi:MAG: hypothetical protein Q8O52_12155 [Sulfuritalea sp.]|nr:hypothetical protein [Sulfuritalea sp.]